MTEAQQGRAMIKNNDGVWEDRTMETLHGAVVRCCGGWGLYEQSDAISQQIKALSECGEACDSVNKGDYEQLKDDIGDILVCLINWCQFMPADFLACWAEPERSEFYQPSDIKGEVVELCAHVSFLPLESDVCETLQVDSLLSCVRALCKHADIDPTECLGVAYDVISKRDIKMLNGTAIKRQEWHKFKELEIYL